MIDEVMPDYGDRVRFAQGELITFSHIALTFIGERHVSHDIYKNGFHFWDFKVACQEEEQVVSWSPGTGDIAGVFFEIAGNRFELELRISDRLGHLARDEFVLWRLD